MENKLLPCPHCGGRAVMVEGKRPENIGRYSVTCGQCFCATRWEISPENAAYDWNRRAAPANPPLTLEKFESVCEAVHNGWWDECKRQGRTNHPDMIPYANLSEPVKEYDRVTVRRVLDALGIFYAHKPEKEDA